MHASRTAEDSIIVGRGLGHTDVFFGPLTELNRHVGRLYRLGHDATPHELDRIAQRWSPWRAWVQVYFRAVRTRPGHLQAVRSGYKLIAQAWPQEGHQSPQGIADRIDRFRGDEVVGHTKVSIKPGP